MKIVPAKCPNCGANINVNEEQETTKCEYCGDAILIDKAIQNYKVQVKISNVPDLNNYLILGERNYNDKDYEKANEYYGKAITLDPNNYLIVLRVALTESLIGDYFNFNNLRNGISNADNLSNSLDEKRTIINDSLETVMLLAKELISYYESNTLNKSQAKKLNDNCILLLDVLKDLTVIEEKIDNNDEQKKVLQKYIIEYTHFVIMPKVYKTGYLKRNGKNTKNSLKIKKNKLKEIYEFWNSVIDKYNINEDKKIKNEKMPFIQLDFYTIRDFFFVAIIIILLIVLIKILFFNNEKFGKYSKKFDCSYYYNEDMNKISKVKYDEEKLDTYMNKIYNFSGILQSINLDGEHPYFTISYNGIKIYINENELNKMKSLKTGDNISFCGIIKSSKSNKVKIENATINDDN